MTRPTWSNTHDPRLRRTSGNDKSLPDMLRDGDIDAAILGNDLPEGDDFVPVIAGRRGQRYGLVAATWLYADQPYGGRQRRIASGSRRASRGALMACSRRPRPSGNLLRPDKPSPVRVRCFCAVRCAWIIDACLEQALLPRKHEPRRGVRARPRDF